MTEPATRRTKRRYAHEMYPHAAEGEIRPLAVELPYLYAVAVGQEVWGTSWFDDRSPEGIRAAADRTMQLIYCRQIAFLADALEQGLVGDEAWAWAEDRLSDEAGEVAYERAEHYGVNPDLIKPYPCGPEPKHHNHYSHGTHGIVTRIPMPESECAECTEPVIHLQGETA